MGYVGGSEGNVSCRIDNNFIITPTGVSLKDVTEENLSLVNEKGDTICGPKPSRELPFHLEVYMSASEVNYIIHTHPEDAITFFKYFNSFKSTKLFEQYYKKPISVIDFLKPGSKKLATCIGKETKKTNAIILREHGLVTTGEKLSDAFNLTELIIKKSSSELKNFQMETLVNK